MRPLADGSGRFQAYALGRIGEGEPRSVRWLDDLRLHQAEELCWRLGSAVKRFSRSLLDQAKGDPIEFQVECDEGLSICEGGPDAVEALLDRVCDHVDNKAAGPNSAYGPFYRWLVNKRRTHPPHVMLLRDLVRTHAVREIPFMQDDTMFGEDVRDNVHISVRSAALQIPLQYRSFVRTALELELMDEKDVRLRRFRRDRLEALEEGRRLRPVARTEFINAFGVGSEGLNWLFRTGRLTEVVGRWPGIPGDEYQAVLKRIGVHRRVSDVDFEFLTLGDERLRRMQAVTALIDGTIVSPGAISPDDPLTLILAVEDVERLGLGKRRVPVMSEAESLEPELDVAPEEKEDLSFPELRQRMSWRAPLARDLLATGLFDVTTVRRTGQMRISVSSIREFERRYVLSTDLHKRYSLPWGDRLRETMVLEGMSVVRLPRHPRIDLLVVDEVEARMAAMRRHRHGWFCDYHRDRDRGDRIRPGRKPDHRGRPDETEERGDHSTQPEGLSAKLGTTSP